MIDDPEFYATLRANLSNAAQLEVLDAGCGNQFPIRLDRACQITGIDVSRESMQRSTRLDRYIVGDIQTHRFDQSFDLIVCMNVLEHVPEPIRAIRNLVSALKPAGVIVLGFPNPLSLKGLVTKFTPHFVHVIILKRVFGYSKAGQKGHAPFPTHLRFELGAKPIVRRLREMGVTVVFLREFEGRQPTELRKRSRVLHSLYALACSIVSAASLRSLRPHLSETLLVARLE